MKDNTDQDFRNDPDYGRFVVKPNPLEVWVGLRPDAAFRADEPKENSTYFSDKDLRIVQSLLQIAIQSIEEELRDRKANSDA